MAFSAIRVSERVYWVGAIDWDVRNFHGYLTSRGTTYNAFLVLAEKVTLIDTVRAPFKDEMMARIASVIEPSKIDLIVSNHAEMDHSGCLPEAIAAIQPEKVYASTMGVKALKAHFPGLGQDILEVKDGETLSLGNMGLTCYETRMLHWPDSMVSWLAEEGILFSQDGFGMHLASAERFDDELDPAVLEQEAAKYFANILLPTSGTAQKVLQRLTGLNLPMKVVAPDHGPLWRRGIGHILGRYASWAEQRPTRKALVVYDTMWHSTELMARAVGEGLREAGAAPKLLPLSVNHRSDVATELLDAGALLVGSPTLNNQAFPTVVECLSYLKGLKRKSLVGAAFGSFGWSGESVKQLEEWLEAMKVERIAEPVSCRYVPDGEVLARARALGESVGTQLVKRLG